MEALEPRSHEALRSKSLTCILIMGSQLSSTFLGIEALCFSFSSLIFTRASVMFGKGNMHITSIRTSSKLLQEHNHFRNIATINIKVKLSITSSSLNRLGQSRRRDRDYLWFSGDSAHII